MFDKMQRFDDSNGVVSKYVFEAKDAVAEAVLYKYKEDDKLKRVVICCSVMSGCPVGCSFCGTGKKFVRILYYAEIIQQVKYILEEQEEVFGISVKNNDVRFQIMFMSMGEPFLNFFNVKAAIINLHHEYSNAELLVSTIAPDTLKDHFKKVPTDFIDLSKNIEKIGLQFSIHESTDEKRNHLIPFKDKLTLREIRDFGIHWSLATHRPVFLNYCVKESNATEQDKENLMNLFSPVFFNFTFSVICSSDETMKDAGFRNLDFIRNFEKAFIKAGYNTRIFNPHGQDDIGGGCGQLWYVQRWMQDKSTS